MESAGIKNLVYGHLKKNADLKLTDDAGPQYAVEAVEVVEAVALHLPTKRTFKTTVMQDGPAFADSSSYHSTQKLYTI